MISEIADDPIKFNDVKHILYNNSNISIVLKWIKCRKMQILFYNNYAKKQG